jgi:hypothetical protein
MAPLKKKCANQVKLNLLTIVQIKVIYPNIGKKILLAIFVLCNDSACRE